LSTSAAAAARRQRAAEVGQQRPPGQHAGQQREQAVRERAGHGRRRDLAELAADLVPPVRQREAERGEHGGGQHDPDCSHGRQATAGTTA
jgi:hypothetical protein